VPYFEALPLRLPSPRQRGRGWREAPEEQDYAGRFNHLLVSDDPASPTYIRKPDNRIVSVVVPWNTGKYKGNFYGHRIFAALSHLVPHFLFLDENSALSSKGRSGVA
jgi:hypothetical protein